MKYLAIGHSMLFVLRICVQRCLSSHRNLILFVLVCNSVEAAHYCINCLQIDYSISKLLFLCALTLLLRHLNLFVGLKHLFIVQHESRIIIILISSAPSSFCPSTSSSLWLYTIQRAASFDLMFSYHDGFQWLAQADLAPDDHERIKIVSISEKFP